jgi:hypothetical protein
MTKIVVAIIHGAGIHTLQDGSVSMQKMSDKLRENIGERFRSNRRGNVSDFIFKPILWDEVSLLHEREEELKTKMRDSGVRFDSMFSIEGFGSIREFLFNAISDIASYQPVSNKNKQYPYIEVSDTYTAIHTVIAQSLKQFAYDYGESARLVVVTHSLGSIIASNYIYDLRQDTENHPLVHANVQNVIGDSPTPFESLKTLDMFVTMGSPMALWSLRHDKFDSPIIVDTWYNFLDKDDVIAYPLEPLLTKKVVQDIHVNAGGLISSRTPLSHLHYWEDDEVINKISENLARIWKKWNDT